MADLADGLRAAIRDGDGLALVADDGTRVIGHVMFTRAVLDAPARLVDVQILSPLAVLPERHGLGTGSALVRRGLEIAIERSVPLVFLEGDPRYYARFGFTPAGGHGFRKPSLRIPDAAFQVLRLPAYGAWMTGTLVYSDPFWQHDAVGLREEGGLG